MDVQSMPIVNMGSVSVIWAFICTMDSALQLLLQLFLQYQLNLTPIVWTLHNVKLQT